MLCMEQILSSHAIWVLVAIAAFAMDFVSDYACDWWSDTCVEFSRLLMYGYTAVAMYVGYMIFRMYHDDGQFVTMKALGGLWAETLHMGQKYFAQAKAMLEEFRRPKAPGAAPEALEMEPLAKPRKSSSKKRKKAKKDE